MKRISRITQIEEIPHVRPCSVHLNSKPPAPPNPPLPFHPGNLCDPCNLWFSLPRMIPVSRSTPSLPSGFSGHQWPSVAISGEIRPKLSQKYFQLDPPVTTRVRLYSPGCSILIEQPVFYATLARQLSALTALTHFFPSRATGFPPGMAQATTGGSVSGAQHRHYVTDCAIAQTHAEPETANCFAALRHCAQGQTCRASPPAQGLAGRTVAARVEPQVFPPA